MSDEESADELRQAHAEALAIVEKQKERINLDHSPGSLVGLPDLLW